jgi:hypothetical protein
MAGPVSGDCYEARCFAAGRLGERLRHDDAAIGAVAERVNLGAVATEPEMLDRMRIGGRLTLSGVSWKSKEPSVPVIKFFCTGRIRAL